MKESELALYGDGFEPVEVQRIQGQHSSTVQDYIVQEYPVALVYNGINHVVMMATPTDLEEFAKGFSLSEGIVSSLKELYSVEIQNNPSGIVLDISISSRAFNSLKAQRRMMVGRTGCGLCGVESLQQFSIALPKVSTVFSTTWLQHIPAAISQLSQKQTISRHTGAAHAAAWVVNGVVDVVFEDVGRHNALDKLLGHLIQNRYDLNTGFVLMTSRASYELIRKCAQLNIGLLACISAPSSMAINLAKQSGLGLVGFCRGQGFVLYT